MAITKQEVVDLVNRFHDLTCIKKGTGEEQAKFFLHPEPRIFILHGEDITLQQNYEIHQRLVDERHVPSDSWEITQLSDNPERARAVGAVYWQGRPVDSQEDELIKAVVGEDWVVQRDAAGALKIALYINSYHHFLPDSAPIDLK
ncbi:MAG: hypothetical protein MK108_11995 [Mariniblastus sp.]|nr:hypothetical protein [Mariniblastus sp.]